MAKSCDVNTKGINKMAYKIRNIIVSDMCDVVADTVIITEIYHLAVIRNKRKTIKKIFKKMAYIFVTWN